jgi:lipoate-protein ligase A
MRSLDLTLSTPAANLACDEALLEWCEAGDAEANGVDEILRFWESPQHFVALGYTNRADREVQRKAARALNIPILRRCSGGGAVLQGPGCLNYALLLRVPEASPLAGVTGANQSIMRRQSAALAAALEIPVTVEGHTDLATRGLKFSGNAQRRKQRFLLFHGTFLLHFDLPLIERVLHPPPHQPPYRQNRAHTDFLTNLDVTAETIKTALRREWQATETLTGWPCERTMELAETKYSADEWNLKFSH